MSEWSRKTKFLILIGLLALFVPIGLASNPGMKRFVDKAKDHDREKDTPERVWWLIRFYYWTGRWEGGDEGYNAQDLAKWWLTRYGGETPDDQRYISWEPSPFTEEHPRPSYWDKEPHRLTPKVLAFLADEIDTTTVFHDRAQHLYQIIKDRFQFDKDALHSAEEGQLRQTKRVLK